VCRLIAEKEEAVKILRSSSGATRRSVRLAKMAAVAYDDEETQQQLQHGECYASDYQPNSESEADSEEEIVSLASTPVPIGRGRQGAPQSRLSSQVPPSSVQAARRPGTPRPSRHLSQVCARIAILSQLGICVLLLWLYHVTHTYTLMYLSLVSV
jgi:hypothetical protein